MISTLPICLLAIKLIVIALLVLSIIIYGLGIVLVICVCTIVALVRAILQLIPSTYRTYFKLPHVAIALLTIHTNSSFIYIYGVLYHKSS